MLEDILLFSNMAAKTTAAFLVFEKPNDYYFV